MRKPQKYCTQSHAIIVWIGISPLSIGSGEPWLQVEIGANTNQFVFSTSGLGEILTFKELESIEELMQAEARRLLTE